MSRIQLCLKKIITNQKKIIVKKFCTYNTSEDQDQDPEPDPNNKWQLMLVAAISTYFVKKINDRKKR